MDVYVEQLLLENLIINYLILYATKVFTKSDTSKLRIFIASFIGSIYTLIIFLPSLMGALKIISKIIVAVIIIKIAFKPKCIRSFIKVIATFHLIAFTFAGLYLSLLYTSSIDTYVTDGVFYISDFKIKKLIIAIAFGWIILQLTFEYLKNKNMKADNIYSFKIIFKNKQVNLKGMVDTGNSLKDPINKLPVIIVEYGAMKELFPVYIQEIFKNHDKNSVDLFADILSRGLDDFKFRLIPFKSLGKEDGMLLGFKADKVIIETAGEDQVKDLIIGIYKQCLSKDHEYQALLHVDTIT